MKEHDCEACCDRGSVSIIAACTVDDLRAKGEECDSFLYTAERQCLCVVGQRRYPGLPLYLSSEVLAPPAVLYSGPMQKKQQFLAAVRSHYKPKDFTDQF